MSDNIEQMDFKQLRTEVQLLRDELAMMKRKYEDLFYNLDTDNFSSRFVKEQGDMRTAIKVNAEGIETKVSNEEFHSTIEQTATEIRQEVEEVESGLSSEISQTASDISLRVKSVEGKTNSISVTDNGIEIDGERTKINSIIYLTDADGDNIAALWCSSENGRHLYLNSAKNPSGREIDYMYLGDAVTAYDYDTDTWEESHNVYVGKEFAGITESWKVATEGWVKKKIAAGGGGTVVAVFG